MDSSDPRTQPIPQQQQRQPHLTQNNQQQPPPPQQQQHLHQHQQNIHPPQHAQQNQPASYAPQQQQQHGYQPMQFPQYQYRHAYPPQFAQHHITHQQPYAQAYAYPHMNYQQPAWVPPAASFSPAPVSTPTTQGAPVASKTVPLLKPREKKVLAIVDPKTNKVINESDIKPTNESKIDTNNKTKSATTVAPATNKTSTSTTAKLAPTVAAVATTKTTTTQQSVATRTPLPAATKNSATPAKANNTPSSKPAPVTTDRANTPSPPSVSNILLQKVSEDSGSLKRPTVAATVIASPTKPKDVAVPPPEVESPKQEAKKEEAPTSSPIVTDSLNNIPPKVESEVKAETDVKKDVVDNVKQEEGVTDDKREDVKDDKDVEADSTKEVAESDGEISLHYEPGQYNPTSNRSGKKKYSRDFMVEVCEKVCKLNIFNEGANDNNMSASYPQLDVKIDMFAPKYQQQQNFANPSRRQIPNNYMGRSSAGQERARKVIAPSSSLTNEVELKTVSNPWRPGMDKKEDEPLDAVEVEKLKKKFRSILNKLTPNNFDNLATAVTDLHIDTEQKLGEVIDIVFAKALAEPGYCVLYGRMCSHLKKITAGTANFGSTLLQRCQGQFQADIYTGVNVDERREKIEDEENQDVKKQLGEELYEEMYRCRMRGLGLIKFIGELYKIEMLNDQIMFDCIGRLLSDASSEESLECLCDLLSTIGEKLDRSSQKKAKDEKKSQKSAPKLVPYQTGGKSAASIVASNNAPQKAPEPQTLDPIFNTLHTIRKNMELPLSLRIRFKLLDVCELKEKENWQSKNTKDNNPKKLEEIRKAHEEKLESERQKQAMGGRRSQEGRRLGPAGGSSNQISSLGNDSGARGGMHGSASSQAIRDQNYGDNRQPNYTDIHKREEQYQKDATSIKKFLPKLLTDKAAQAAGSDLRPMGLFRPTFTKPVVAAPIANSNSSSTNSNSTANTNSANAAADGSQ